MPKEHDVKWLDTPQEGWAAIQLPSAVLKDNFVSGDKSGRRLDVRYFRDSADGCFRAKAVLGPAAQGPPGHAHGGSMAALLDEAMGGAAWMAGHMAVAAELTARFQEMLPLGTRCIVDAHIVSVDGRKVRVAAVLRDEAGTIYTEGEALFITLDPEKFGALAAEASRLFTDLDKGE